MTVIKLTIDNRYINTFLMLLKKLKYVKKVEIDSQIADATEGGIGFNDFQKFLLEGPVMSDEDYQCYLEKRQKLNEWKPFS